MRTIWEWVGSLFGGDVKVIKVDGKETKEAKGRAKRLKEVRQYKERVRRSGNKNLTGD